ncbi:cutinase family protein [Corynebacterium testudinoris]|uniref:Cutinase n=1 Tax=Corynebacterium testudinoris TaxID=136857 RepID=A0A0G3HB15_9CORY|nr:cutinase family protein [Corynebacterium testudinoris]AKK09880.1 Cutinase [Corynebacterium testudinoris]MBX8996390.1 cutinase family protein [Corynebacterium testudinoris]
MRKTLTILAVIVLVVVIGAGALRFMRTTDQIPTPPLGQQPTEDVQQPEWCPAVEFISAPGTWESAPGDDPVNPTANPWSFMLSITQPLQERYAPDNVKVWTLPYTAQFRNINAQNEMSYDDSRQEGLAKLEEELVLTHSECPLTDFIMVGFSQGAVIVGDVANKIGKDNGVVPAERIRGVALIADGRREPGVGQFPGTYVDGVGAEVALAPLNLLVQPIVPGATMRGPRDGGYGSLQDRTFDICAPNDSICDAPLNVGNALDRALALVAANGIHAQYATNPDVIPGTTVNAWVVDWAIGLIDGR